MFIYVWIFIDPFYFCSKILFFIQRICFLPLIIRIDNHFFVFFLNSNILEGEKILSCCK